MRESLYGIDSEVYEIRAANGIGSIASQVNAAYEIARKSLRSVLLKRFGSGFGTGMLRLRKSFWRPDFREQREMTVFTVYAGAEKGSGIRHPQNDMMSSPI